MKTELEKLQRINSTVHMQDATWIWFTVCGQPQLLRTVNDWRFVTCPQCLAERRP